MSPFYFITDSTVCPAAETGFQSKRQKLVTAVEEAISGGARLVQYRETGAERYKMYETAVLLRQITTRHGVTLIINDFIDLALAVKADGVHLGQDDLPLWVARRLLGKEVIIGISTHSLGEAIAAELEGADYIGFGPIFHTQTKVSSYKPVGVEAISEVKKQVAIPLYAIGGITLSALPTVISAGADGVAVISAVAVSGEIRSNVAQWIVLLNDAAGGHC